LGPIEEKVSGLYYSGDGAKSGLAVKTDVPTDPIFWAGYTGNGDTPWRHQKEGGSGSWSDKTAFYVTGEGKVVCRNIEATGGSFGELEIGATAFAWPQWRQNQTNQVANVWLPGKYKNINGDDCNFFIRSDGIVG
jgi:hypothetical protein